MSSSEPDKVLDSSSTSASRRSTVSSHHQFRHSESDSDSDGSEDDSLSVSSSVQEPAKPNATPAAKRAKHRKRHKHDQKWEIMEGLKEGQRCETKPEKYQGYMMKKRKWPMKGWHKRFFILEKGILSYSKSPIDIGKGKYHDQIDTGLSVLAYKRHRHRIDIDAEPLIHHVKVKDKEVFEEWISRLKHHRLYRQHEIAYGTKELPRLTEITSPTDDLSLPPIPSSLQFAEKPHDRTLVLKNSVIRQPSLKGRTLDRSQSRVAAWLLDSAGFEHCNRELNESQTLLCDLHEDLSQMRSLPLATDSSSIELSEEQDKKKKKVPKSAKKKDHKKNNSLQTVEPIASSTSSGSLAVSQDSMRTSSSNPNLLDHDEVFPVVLTHEQRIEELKLREHFLNTSERVHKNLKSLLHLMSTERDRLKCALEADNGTTGAVNTLKTQLAEVILQNDELRRRLGRICAEANVENLPKFQSPITSPVEKVHVHANLSQSMSAESCSISEYHDAQEFHESASYSSSERSEEEISSDISDENDTDYAAALSENTTTMVSGDNWLVDSFQTGRRSKLPVSQPDNGDVSLWNLLYKNIGKDLTKISMPVTLNEPLSMLQRLCEELEYSELLDKAPEYDNACDRMMYIAAFAVSSYASSCHRAGHKPFNPLLGETYECIREDKGWRFIAEQVSHHPPISACFCDSKNFVFWQDVQIKTKFWGRSMEIQPIGVVNVMLPKHGDHYKWNKVTTCVHNLLGGQKWVDQYGEMTIRNGDIKCKLTFTKASQWSGKRHDVYGTITGVDGKVVHNLFGKWNEALYCGHAPSARCIWRLGAMPDDYELYYGFSRFAIELNELPKELNGLLPLTDSRHRPDQRLLEEGLVKESEKEKTRVEQIQRERRKDREEGGVDHVPLWFKKTSQNGVDHYVYSDTYWEARKDPGFSNLSLPKLW